MCQYTRPVRADPVICGGAIPGYFTVRPEHIRKRASFRKRLHAGYPDMLVGILSVHAAFCRLDHYGFCHVDTMEECKVSPYRRTVDHQLVKDRCHEPKAVIGKDRCFGKEHPLAG